LPEFEVTVVTVRYGAHHVHVEAPDPAAAISLIQADCQEDRCHCPAECCTDDVNSEPVAVRELPAVLQSGGDEPARLRRASV
jgi:hypothetical protein